MKKLIILLTALMLVSCQQNYKTVQKCDEIVKTIQSTNITGRDTQGAEGVTVGGIYGCMGGAGIGAVGGPVGMVGGCVMGAIGLGAVGGAMGATEESNIYIVNDTEGNQYSCERDSCLDLQSNRWEVKEQKTLVKRDCRFVREFY